MTAVRAAGRWLAALHARAVTALADLLDAADKPYGCHAARRAERRP
jgi:hypothetical protein